MGAQSVAGFQSCCVTTTRPLIVLFSHCTLPWVCVLKITLTFKIPSKQAPQTCVCECVCSSYACLAQGVCGGVIREEATLRSPSPTLQTADTLLWPRSCYTHTHTHPQAVASGSVGWVGVVCSWSVPYVSILDARNLLWMFIGGDFFSLYMQLNGAKLYLVLLLGSPRFSGKLILLLNRCSLCPVWRFEFVTTEELGRWCWSSC